MVSHDRYFLNKVCTQIADIDYGKIQLYAGNYDFWFESSQLLIKQMKGSQQEKRRERSKNFRNLFPDSVPTLPSPNRRLPRKRALEKIQLDDMRPSSRKYPYIDFRPNPRDR